MSHRVLLKFSLTHCSQSDFNTIIRAISKRLGKHWFPENIHTAASEYANCQEVILTILLIRLTFTIVIRLGHNLEI